MPKTNFVLATYWLIFALLNLYPYWQAWGGQKGIEVRVERLAMGQGQTLRPEQAQGLVNRVAGIFGDLVGVEVDPLSQASDQDLLVQFSLTNRDSKDWYVQVDEFSVFAEDRKLFKGALNLQGPLHLPAGEEVSVRTFIEPTYSQWNKILREQSQVHFKCQARLKTGPIWIDWALDKPIELQP